MATLQLPETMKAWQKHAGAREPILVEVPVPMVSDTGLLVKVYAAGVCHSDVLILSNDEKPVPTAQDKYTLGHEGCGKVVQVGKKAGSFGFEVGDMIAFVAGGICDSPSCRYCQKGYSQLCPDAKPCGLGHDGSFAPYVAIEANTAAALPSGVSAAQGAVATDAVLTAHHAVVETADVKAGQTVLQIGLGGVGLNATQIALSLGARVIVADKRKEVLDEAVRLGVRIDDIIPPDADVVQWIREKRVEVDTALDFVGAQQTFDAAIASVCSLGTVVVIGLFAQQLTIPVLVVTPKHLKILFSFGGSLHNLEASLDLIAKKVVVPQVVSRPLNDLPQVLDDLHHGRVKSRVALVPAELGTRYT